MTQQEVIFDHHARKELLAGATILANAVRVTMGPSGHNVIIDTGSGMPIITKDGVTVAKAVSLRNRMQSMGAELLKEVATKTNDLAGDGTTTSVVVAYALLYQGEKMISSGRSSVLIKRGMELGSQKVIDFLKEVAVPVKNSDDIKHIGTISANGDVHIGELLAEAMEKVGKDGVITIEEAKSLATTLEVVEGMRMEGGYVSPFFVTNQEKMTSELINPLVLVTSKKLNNLQEILPILEIVSRARRPLLVVGDEIEGEVLQAMVLNKLKGALEICAVKAPSYGDHREELLEDLAVLTGTQFISNASGVALKGLVLANLGSCKKVIVTRHTTTFVANTTDPQTKHNIDNKVATLRTQLETDATLDDLQKVRIKARLAKLSGGVAVIKVGGATEVEMKERKDRVDDALNATMAAAQEGIVPGGGSALYHASLFLAQELETSLKSLNEDEKAGVDVVRLACQEPFFQILKNAGKLPELIAEKIKEEAKRQSSLLVFDTEQSKNRYEMRFGYDSRKYQVCDVFEQGVIDPILVERASVQNAVSVVGLMLTTDCVIIQPEDTV
jgi:chaperonin GroEL